MSADGIYIPMEQNSTEINQFRQISLLNVEGKIFFSVMAFRLTKYLTENGYIKYKGPKRRHSRSFLMFRKSGCYHESAGHSVERGDFDQFLVNHLPHERLSRNSVIRGLISNSGQSKFYFKILFGLLEEWCDFPQ